MNIDLHLLSNLNYDTTLQVFPFVVEIRADTTMTIALKVDILEINLEHTESDFGFSRQSHGALGILRDTIEVGPQLSHFILLDAMEYEDDVLEKGNYILTVRLRVYVATGGRFEPVELTSSRKVNVDGAVIS